MISLHVYVHVCGEGARIVLIVNYVELETELYAYICMYVCMVESMRAI